MSDDQSQPFLHFMHNGVQYSVPVSRIRLSDLSLSIDGDVLSYTLRIGQPEGEDEL